MSKSVVFLVDNKPRLYIEFFINFSIALQKEGWVTGIFFREGEKKIFTNGEFVKIFNSFSTIYTYGDIYIEPNSSVKSNLLNDYCLQHYCYKSLLKTFKIELSKVPTNTIFITPNAYDISVKLLLKDKNLRKAKIVYWQIGCIVNAFSKITFRAIKDNIFSFLAIGTFVNSNPENPPFYSYKLIYSLWSPIWANNVPINKYKIFFTARTLNCIPNKNKIISDYKIKRILVILNKTSFIGVEDWKKYADFYIEMAEETNFLIEFKSHPSDNKGMAREFFVDYEVHFSEVDINKYDLVLSHWSTMIYDVLILGKPLFLVNPYNNFNFEKFRMNNYPLFITKPKELNVLVEKLNNGKIQFDEIREAFLKEQLGDDFSTNFSNSIKLLDSI
jgi:hypothetical protein